MKKPRLILTIGHSTRDLEDFISILRTHGVTRVMDVRTVPRSRHNPQYDKDALPKSLGAAGIAYEHVPGLGGFRPVHKDSPNQGWRNASFRGYADYMQSAEFEENLRLLMDQKKGEQVVLMCAEAVPWRCHRSLIADALAVRGVPVEHILGAGRTQMHKITPWAHVRGKRITYPGEAVTAPEESNADAGPSAAKQSSGPKGHSK